MAGSYPDVPGPRLAYDIDGTTATKIFGQDNSIQQLTQTQINGLNDENDGTGFGLGSTTYVNKLALLFPSPRDITAMYIRQDNTNNVNNIDWSFDTTNGFDGTWSTPISVNHYSPTVPNYRTNIVPVTIPTGIKAIRIAFNASSIQTLYTWHLFGSPSAGADPDRLRFWHPSLDQPLSQTPAYLDFGDFLRGDVQTRGFRIKNNSSTLTARSVSVSAWTPNDESPSLIPQFLFSLDGTTFTSSVTIGDLAPQALSGTVWVRKTTDPAATLGLFALRLRAATTGFG